MVHKFSFDKNDRRCNPLLTFFHFCAIGPQSWANGPEEIPPGQWLPCCGWLGSDWVLVDPPAGRGLRVDSALGGSSVDPSGYPAHDGMGESGRGQRGQLSDHRREAERNAGEQIFESPAKRSKSTHTPVKVRTLTWTGLERAYFVGTQGARFFYDSHYLHTHLLEIFLHKNFLNIGMPKLYLLVFHFFCFTEIPN